MTININRRERSRRRRRPRRLGRRCRASKARAATSTQASRLPLKADQLATYISINADGSAVGWIGKVDMGQGTDIGWIKMIAEELDLPTDRVSMVQGHTDLTINHGRRLRLDRHLEGRRGACATPPPKRAACCVEMASEKLGVPADRLTVNDGVVSDKNDAAQEGHLRRADRRAAFRRRARVEQADRQRAR